MAFEEMLKLVAAVTTSFGSGAVVVILLSKWLGGLWAGRILQEERGKIEVKLSEFGHELSLAKASYDHYLDLVLDYYKVFYRHYRICQRASEADAHRQSDGSITRTKDEYFDALDAHLVDWAEREGKLRILLPSPILATHVEAVNAFNSFKRAIQKFDTSEEARRSKKDAFIAIDAVKQKLEQQLREFLRTENLLK